MNTTQVKKVTKKVTALETLIKSSGVYKGTGTNLEKQEFKGMLTITPIATRNGVYIEYAAVGTAGTEYNNDANLYSLDTMYFHEEHTIVAKDNKNHLCMWTLSNVHPTMSLFKLRRMRHIPDEKTIMIFGFGTVEESSVFREEISIEISENGELVYTYSWGESDGSYLSRHSARMNKVSKSFPL